MSGRSFLCDLWFSQTLRHKNGISIPLYICSIYILKWALGNGGGANLIFSQDTPKFGFGDGQKWGKLGKKVNGKRGKQTFHFQIEKIPIFSHDAPKFGFGDGKNVKKCGKNYIEGEGKSIRFNKLLYIIIIVFCILNKIFRLP